MIPHMRILSDVKYYTEFSNWVIVSHFHVNFVLGHNFLVKFIPLLCVTLPITVPLFPLVHWLKKIAHIKFRIYLIFTSESCIQNDTTQIVYGV